MATGRRGRKTTAKRKPKRKAAPARKKKARAKAPSKKKRAKAKAAKRKPARKTAKRTARKTIRKTKPQGARAKMVRRMRRPTAAAPPPIPEAVPAPPLAPIPRAMPAAPPPADDMELAVERALRAAGYEPPDGTAVAVLAAIGRGYAQGPASPPSWLHVDVARPIAEGLVERFATGDRAHDIDRGTHRPTTRATVNIVLSQTPGDPVGDPERAVLASFCLGSWDPATDEHAERNGIAGFVIPWYMVGRA